MSNPLDDLIAASAPRDVPSVVDPGPGFHAGASFYDGESISLPVTGGECSVFSITVIERPEEICGGLLKHNETACFKNKRSCRSSHRGDGRITLAEEAFVAVVARNKETIFCVPSVPVSFIASSLLDRWSQEKRTKLEWNKRFDIVRFLHQDKPVDEEAYYKQLDAQAVAKRVLKTPGKVKAKLFIGDSCEEEEIHFEPFIKPEKGAPSEDSESRLNKLESFLIQETENNEERWLALKEILQDNAVTSKFHTTQINSIDTMVGVRDTRSFPQEFDGTDLWSTIGSIGRKVLEETRPNIDALANQIQDRYLSDLDTKFTATEQFNKFVSHMTGWFSTYHENKIAVWNKLHLLESRTNQTPQGNFFNQFQGVHSSFMHQPASYNEANRSHGPTLKEHRELKDEVDRLKALILKVSLEKDQVSIRFGALAFNGVDDARAFVANQPEARNFGLLIDPYSVCCHVLKETKGHNNFFNRLQHIKKLGIGTNREAIVMHGFNSPIPELFDVANEYQSSPHTSSFSKFPTYKDWFDKGKDQIPMGITKVRAQLNIHADNFLKQGSKIHTICKLSIAESCAAMDQFCTWLNKSHTNLVTYGMSKDKAWILTTKLGERVFRELFSVRSGVADGFNVSCGEDDARNDIAANIWFYVPRTLDILKTFVDADFGNHESIAGEYIRFLVHNTNSSEVSTFQADISDLKEKINNNKKYWDKEFKAVQSSADSANKAVTAMGHKLTDQNKKLKDWASGQFASK